MSQRAAPLALQVNSNLAPGEPAFTEAELDAGLKRPPAMDQWMGRLGILSLWPLEIEVLLQIFYSKGWCIFLQYKLGILASQNLNLLNSWQAGKIEQDHD